MTTFTHVIVDPLGLHARPAGLMTKEASAYKCNISVEAPAGTANPKKVIMLLSLGAKEGDELVFTFDGEDEAAAASALQAFCKENL